MEEWKQIEGWEWLYQVSNFWNVRSYVNWRWGKRSNPVILKKSIKRWYHIVNLSWTTKIVHRLVAQHFIKNPDNLPCVLHIIEQYPSNDYVNNLKWWTQKDNMKDMALKWRAPNKYKTWLLSNCSKKIIQLSINWEFIKKWDSMADIRRELLISSWGICRCCKWERKTAGWFKFIYG